MSVEGKFLSKEISELFWKENLTLATAESCTAGNVAAAITAVAGTSHLFKGGIIAYSNEVKENLIGLSHEAMETYGDESKEYVIDLENKKIKIFVDYGLKLRYNAILQGYILKGGFSLC